MSSSPTMFAVESSLFSAVGFNPDTSEFLGQFKSGTLGAYGPTTQEEFDEVISAPSVGIAFNKLIKPTKHYRKVDPAAPLTLVESHPAVEETVASVAVIPAPEQELEVQQQTTDLAAQALTLAIATPAAHVAGQELIISIGSMRKQVEKFFEPMKTAAHAAHKAVCNRETETLKPLIDAQKALSAKLVAFERQVEADRWAEQERLRIENRAIADREAKEESERLALDDAIALEDAGDVVAAAAVLANPTPIAPRYVPAPIVASPIARVAGAIVKETWKARVTNINLVPREWMVADEAALNKHAANRKQMAVVSGVEFYPETSMHGRSK
jgi:hypothetical protein